MATYKVIQDIEAEDKFLGPLTLKQFISAAIAILSTYISFLLLTKGVWVLVFPLVPVIVVTGFLAFPWGRDQPTEIWLLAKIRFMFKPRRRIWDQAGTQELVKITAPVKMEEVLSDNLSQTEVKSRLQALAETIDSRGWAVKNVPATDYAQNGSLALPASDRLIDASSLPQVSTTIDPGVVDDMFDSPRADQVASQIAQSNQQHKNDVVENMTQTNSGVAAGSQPPADFWFMNQPATSNPSLANFGTQSVSASDDDDVLPANLRKPAPLDASDAKILKKIHAEKAQAHQTFRNHKSVLPTDARAHGNSNASPVTAAPDPVTIELARNNDRNIDSLARETNQVHRPPDDDEVIISLH